MTRKLKEFIDDVEHCLTVEYQKHDIELDVGLIILCPYIKTNESAFKFKWAFTIAYN